MKVLLLFSALAVLLDVCYAECGLSALGCVASIGAIMTDDPTNTESICNAYKTMLTCLASIDCDPDTAMGDSSANVKAMCGITGKTTTTQQDTTTTVSSMKPTTGAEETQTPNSNNGETTSSGNPPTDSVGSVQVSTTCTVIAVVSSYVTQWK